MRVRTAAATVGLAVLAVGDVVLVVLALGMGDPGAVTTRQPATGPVQVLPSAPTPSLGGSGAPATAGRGSPAPFPASPGGWSPVPIAASSAVILRADPGTCRDGGAALWSTRDGVTWEELPAPVEEIRRVAVDSPTDLWIVGSRPRGETAESADPTASVAPCDAGFWRSDDAGQTWTQAPSTNGAWYVPADGPDRGSLHAPRTVVPGVCAQADPMLVVPAGFDSAAVGCTDGAVRWTDDGGQQWRAGAPVPGLVALGLWSPHDGLAVAVEEACAGLSVRVTDDGGQSWRQGSCVATPAGSKATGIGVAAYDDVRAALVLGSGPRPDVWVSQDAGRTWRAPEAGS